MVTELNIAKQSTSEEILAKLNSGPAVSGNEILVDGKLYAPEYRFQWHYDDEFQTHTTSQTDSTSTVVEDNQFFIAGNNIYRRCETDSSKDGIIMPVSGADVPSYSGNNTINAQSSSTVYMYDITENKSYTMPRVQVQVPSAPSQRLFIPNLGLCIAPYSNAINSYNYKTNTFVSQVNLGTIWTSLGYSGTLQYGKYPLFYADGFVYLHAYVGGANQSAIFKFSVNESGLTFIGAGKLNVNTSTYIISGWVYDGTFIGLTYRYGNLIYYSSVKISDMSVPYAVGAPVGFYSLGGTHTIFPECYGADNLSFSIVTSATNPLPGSSSVGGYKFVFDELAFLSTGELCVKNRTIKTLYEFSPLLFNNGTFSAPQGYYGKDRFLVFATTGYNLRFVKMPKICGYKEVK